MDSPHEEIEAWWPDDGPAFATNANELLTARNNESASLLGSNLPIPDFIGGGPLVDVQAFAQEAHHDPVTPWDGIQDAMEPVRNLVTGPTALITASTYQLHRLTTHRVMCRVTALDLPEGADLARETRHHVSTKEVRPGVPGAGGGPVPEAVGAAR